MHRAGEKLLQIAHELGRAHQGPGVDVNADRVAIAKFAEGSAGKGFRGGVAKAGTGGHPRESRVGEHREVLADR